MEPKHLSCPESGSMYQRGILEKHPKQDHAHQGEAPMKKYIVKLSREERADLHHLIAQGQASARKLAHARIFLKADSSEDGPGWTDQAISEALEIGTATVERVRQRLVEEGVTAALNRHRPHTPRLRKLDGEQEGVPVASGQRPTLRREVASAAISAILHGNWQKTTLHFIALLGICLLSKWCATSASVFAQSSAQTRPTLYNTVVRISPCQAEIQNRLE